MTIASLKEMVKDKSEEEQSKFIKRFMEIMKDVTILEIYAANQAYYDIFNVKYVKSQSGKVENAADYFKSNLR